MLCSIFVMLLMSCQRAVNYDQHYRAAVRSGFKVIPESLEMEKLFGEADHFITHYGMKEGPLQWNSEVHFYSRYVLTMQVRVELSGRYGTIVQVVDKPHYYLIELKNVFTEDGQLGTKDGIQHTFGPPEWKKLVENQGDFSVIGITVYRDRPVAMFDEYVKAVRTPRIPVRP